MKTLKSWERWSIITILLLAWALRWIALLDVPPGWRDDDLIELYTFSQATLKNGPVWYFPGASGHEPLYHILRAPLLAVAGLNPASARWYAACFGTLTVLLTWAVARRTFTREVGLLSATLVAVSFWALMYSRIAIRQIGTLPWLLLALYWGWRVLQDTAPPRYAGWGLAIGTAGATLTYYAGRLTPVLLAVAVVFVGGKKGRWRSYLLALAIGVLLTAPMFWTAAHVPGGDARLSEVAVPLTELRTGNLRPLLQTTWTTLGMFYAHGDPEWLYNISERAVFGAIGAAIFYIGVLTRLAHLDQANARLLLLWLGGGLAPACISLPPSSYGHTILALPAVYILMAMPMQAAARRWQWTTIPLLALTLLAVAARDIPDYFVTWPRHSMVRFLYRADYRALTHHLRTHPDIEAVAVGSMLFGPWDKMAVQTDQPPAVQLRWVNPQRALLGAAPAMPFYFQDENHIHPHIQTLLDTSPVIPAPTGMRGVLVNLPMPPREAYTMTASGTPLAALAFAEALRLQAVAVTPSPAPGTESTVALWWDVVAPLPLPPATLIANPPPPGVYNGPRLKVFVHLMTVNDGIFITGDDGLWVDPYSVQIGDQFVQWHHLSLSADAPVGPYHINVGLYDPLTGERWLVGENQDEMLRFRLDPSSGR